MTQASHEYIDFLDMTGGLNTVNSAILLKTDECRDIQDMDYLPIGGFTKRNGYKLLDNPSPDTNAITGLYMGRYSLNGGTNIAYRVSGTKLYKMTSALNGTWTDITSGLTITAAANNIFNFAILNDIVVLCNNVDNPIQISSSGTASALTLTTLTLFKFCVESRGYMWYFVPTVGGNIQYDRGYFSNINDPTTVGTNNFVNVAVGQGGDVRGAVEYKGYLYVFKRHGIYQIIFQPTQIDSSGNLFPWSQYPNPIVPGVGTQSHRSIVKFSTPSDHIAPGEYVFFVDQFGVPRLFDGTTTLSFSPKIGSSRDTTIRSLADMDQTRNPFCFSINYPNKNRILCFMSKTNSQQDTCWVFDYSKKFAITRYNFFSPMNVGALFEKSNGAFKPFVGDYSGGVHETDTGSNDNGKPISDYYVSGDSYLESPIMRSKWFFMEMRGQNGSTSQNTKISYYLDGSDTSVLTDTKSLATTLTLWGSGPPAMIWGQSSWAKQGVTTAFSEVNMVGKTLRVKLESSNKLTDTLLIESFTLAGNALGPSQV